MCPNKEEFGELYNNPAILIKDIAEKYQVNPRTVSKWANQCGFGTRYKKEYKKPESGTRFKQLVFLEEDRARGDRLHWMCRCDCGEVKSFYYYGVWKGLTSSCGCYQKARVRALTWTGHGDISGKYWSGIKKGAENRSIEFNLSIEYAWDLFLFQDRKCALSGIDLQFSRAVDRFPQTASLDRRDNNVGYTEGNVQWVHKDINMMKQKFSQEYFANLCVLVANNYIGTGGKHESQNFFTQQGESFCDRHPE